MDTAELHGGAASRSQGWRGVIADWSSDQRSFKGASWGKAMMWVFLLIHTFLFVLFILSYMTVRMTPTYASTDTSEVLNTCTPITRLRLNPFAFVIRT